MPARKWTDEQRAEAVELAATVGLPEASKRTGIGKSYISTLCKRAGVVTFTAENARAQTARAREMRAMSIEEHKAALVELLARNAHLGAVRIAEILERLEAATSDDLHAVVGAVTRSVKDLQLLTGGATSRHELAGIAEARELADELAQRRARKVG